MPSSRLSLDFKGLVTAPGALAAPPGSLTHASNVDFPAPGLAEKRKGIKAAASGFTNGAVWSVISTKQLGANLIFNSGNTGAGNDEASILRYGDGTAAPTTLTTPDSSAFHNVATERMKCAVSLKNHYLTSDRATARVNSDMSLVFAGMPRSPGVYGAGGTTLAAGTWLAAGNGVAYRTVFISTDAESVPVVSPPSGRFVIANIATTTGYTGAARAVTLRCLLPYLTETNSTPITTTTGSVYRLQLYRSIQSTVATAEPNDELQLVYETKLSAANILAGYIDITDTCPESVMGAYLYTNTVSGGDVLTGLVRPGSTGLGIAASNDRPPIAKDIASYANCLWYANTTTPWRQVVSIIALGAGGLAVGDVLDLGQVGVTWTAVAGAPANATQFKVELGLASTALNIRATAMNFCEAVNALTTNTNVTATYIGNDASPGTVGQMLFENRRTDGSQFHLGTTGLTSPFIPNLSVADSSRDAWGNGLACSKPFQGDAVPPVNYLRVGRNDTTIQRVMSLRDALFVFTDDGIWWVRGNTPADFVLDQFDTTFRLLARDCCVSVGDAIYAWGYEGIARITTGGVEYIDLPIRNTVQAIQRGETAAVSLTDFQKRAFAVAYRTQRKVLFFYPNGSETGGYACSRALVFHVSMGVWSTYAFEKANDNTVNGKLAGVVRWSDELLHLTEWVSGGNSQLYLERSTETTADYRDTDATGSGQVITSLMQWTSTVPEAGTLCHWTEAHCFWSPPDDEHLGLPTSVTVALAVEAGTSQSTVVAPLVVQSRVMAGTTVGYGARMVMQVTHNTIDDYFSMSGMALLYNPVSNFTVRGS